MKTMMMVLAIIGLFTGSAFAGDGLHGLEIGGGSSVGAEHYMGVSYSRAIGHTCLSDGRTVTVQVFRGAGISSHANGNVCLSTAGNQGNVSGNGFFRSKVSGNIMGQNYSTVSSVVVKGSN